MSHHVPRYHIILSKYLDTILKIYVISLTLVDVQKM